MYKRQHEELEMDVCPVCGSKNLTNIDRMNGYLSYSRVHGDTRLNTAKMAEIAERKSCLLYTSLFSGAYRKPF